MSNSPHELKTESGKPGSYTRADVVETALRILDQFGLADLSMRRLAATLDIQPSALYWHVPNKQTLLALVSDQIIGRAAKIDRASFMSDGAIDWKELTLAEVRAIADALMAYRDGAEVVSSTLALGLGGDDAIKRIRSGIESAEGVLAEPADSELVRITADSILFLILGQVWHQQQRMQADSLGVVSTDVSTTPNGLADAKSPDYADALGFGISLILQGLESQLTNKST